MDTIVSKLYERKALKDSLKYTVLALESCDSAKAARVAQIKDIEFVRFTLENTVKTLKEDRLKLYSALEITEKQRDNEVLIGNKKLWKGLKIGALIVLIVETGLLLIF